MMADMPARKAQTGVLLLAAFALVWAGMVIGVSALATPVKFAAPSLSLPVALDVGRVTFHLFSRIEWGLALVLVLLGGAARLRLWWLAAGLVAVVIGAQAIWLLPALDARVAAAIAGSPLPPSPLHAWYVAAEAVKLATLLALGLWPLFGARR